MNQVAGKLVNPDGSLDWKSMTELCSRDGMKSLFAFWQDQRLRRTWARMGIVISSAVGIDDLDYYI